ncbi:MAG: glycosyltransferase family 4 protein, partial [Acidobacteria bacterium]|nr:glycosyltransferase family 4 protein [Acidobacteriota bacterium]
ICAPSIRENSGNVDGLPNVVLEAMASGTPLVTTAAGGIGAVIESGRTGLIVPERDSGAIAGAIRELLDDPGRAREIGDAARREVDRRFGWDRAAARFEAAYDRALAFRLLPS